MRLTFRRFNTVLVLGLLLLSVVPLAFAETESGRSYGNSADRAPHDADARKPARIRSISVEPVDVAGKGVLGKQDVMKKKKLARERKEKRMHLKALRYELQDKKKDVRTSLRDLSTKDTFDDAASGKALRIITYALDILERLETKLGAAIESVEEHKDTKRFVQFLANHPDALTRLRTILGEFEDIQTQLEAVIADKVVTREEWKEQAVPVLKQLREHLHKLKRQHGKLFRSLNDFHKDTATLRLQQALPHMKDKLVADGVPEEEAVERVEQLRGSIAQLRTPSVAAHRAHAEDLLQDVEDSVSDSQEGSGGNNVQRVETVGVIA